MTDWATIYAVTAAIVGVVVGLGLFGAVWLIGAGEFGVWAYLLGWIPAGIIAMIGGAFCGALWPAVAIGAVWWWLTGYWRFGAWPWRA